MVQNIINKLLRSIVEVRGHRGSLSSFWFPVMGVVGLTGQVLQLLRNIYMFSCHKNSQISYTLLPANFPSKLGVQLIC